MDERQIHILRERGFEVSTAPEAFTILASNGLSLDYFATDGIENILKARGLKMEQLTWNVASSQFFKVVLTGCACVVEERQLTAACGRKTDTYLRERGFEVFTAPEAFTILASNGLSLDYFATDGIENILKARGLPAVLLCCVVYSRWSSLHGTSTMGTCLESSKLATSERPRRKIQCRLSHGDGSPEG